MKANIKTIILIVVIFAVIIAAVSIFTSTLKKEEDFVYSDLVDLFENDLVTSFDVDGNLKMTVVALKIERDKDGNPVLDQSGAFKQIIDEKTGNPATESYSYSLSYNFQLDQINELALRNYQGGGKYVNLKDYNYQRPAETPWYQAFLRWGN